MIKLLDTFAGVGGFHLALEQSIGKQNVKCIGYSEIDKFAKQVYEKYFPNTLDLGSITELDIENLEDFDLLTGGFPCQDVSVAGKQNLEEGGRTILVEYLLQILEKKQPKYFVFENVKGLMGKKFTEFRESIFDRINACGYNLSYKILNTKDFGLPQNRERVFMVGKRWDYDDTFINFPKGQELIIFLKDILEEEVDEKYYLTEEQYKGLLFNQTLNNQSTIKIVNATKQGYINAYEGDGIILDYPNSKTKRGRIKSKISGTLTCAGSNGVILKDSNIRKLTPTEYARLQGFPDGWSTDYVSNSQTYKQMGNAISVPVVKAIFNNLFNIKG